VDKYTLLVIHSERKQLNDIKRMDGQRRLER